MCINKLMNPQCVLLDLKNGRGLWYMATSLKEKYSPFHFNCNGPTLIVYLGCNVAFNTVQVISRRVVGRAEETST